MGLRDLPVLGSVTGAPPKPAKGSDRTRRRKARTNAGKAFREAVRTAAGYRCHDCGRSIVRTADIERPDAAHVHHLRGRNVAPEDRYNPAAAIALCSGCHRRRHHQ